MNFYAFNIGDYAGATRHLSWDEDMAYRRMLDAYYSREAPLPLERRQIYRLVGASENRQREAVDVVLEEFFEERADGWHNNRADEEIAKTSIKKEKARASAMLSVAARQQRSNPELRQERLEKTREKATHTLAEWEALKQACGNACVKCGDVPVVKDHITPIYQGGSDGIENLQPLCQSCNSAKGPEAVDYRPSEGLAVVKRLLSERSHNTSDRSTNAAETPNGRLAPNPNPNPNPKIIDEDGRIARARATPPDPDAFRKTEQALTAISELDSQPVSINTVYAPIYQLVLEGLDLDTQIIPSIRRQAALATRPIKSWKYFVEGILNDARPIEISGARPNGSQRPRRRGAAQDIADAFDRLDERIAERDTGS
jgi:uncharacterized protein YdaU (DUF1376 family)